jgi:uroporphyrin-III C-methyltransferase
MAPALLTAIDATSHIHLIIGSNPLAGARCSRAVEVGAKPILIAPEDSTLHYGLVKRIEAGEVKWLQRGFQEDDLTTLGRPEVNNVVDAVYVTAGGKLLVCTHSLVCKSPLTCYSYPDLDPLSKTAHTCECCRRAESLLLHSPIHTL